MALKLLIIGTSNSIRRGGYREMLAALRPDVEIHLHGVGGSPSILLPYVLSGLVAEGAFAFDHVVIDTLVNDSGHTANGWADESLCEMALFEAIEWIMARGVPVTLLLMPQTNVVEQARRLRERRRSLAAARGVAVVDGYDVVDALRAAFELNDARLFDDKAHASWPVNLILARRLAALIGAAAPAPQGAPAPLPYFTLPLGEPGAARIQRASSLTARSYLPLWQGAPVTLVTEAPAELLGIAFNTARASGFLRIETEGGVVVKDLRTETDGPGDPEREMVHMVAATQTPLRGTRFVFSMHAERPSGTLDATKRIGEAVGQSRGEAEIEAAVFRDAQRPPWRPGEAAPAPLEAAGLRPEEVAIGLTATIAFSQDQRSLASRFFRARIANEPAFWERRPQQMARLLIEFAALLGEEGASRRLARMASAQFPKAGLARGEEQGERPRPPGPAGAARPRRAP